MRVYGLALEGEINLKLENLAKVFVKKHFFKINLKLDIFLSKDLRNACMSRCLGSSRVPLIALEDLGLNRITRKQIFSLQRSFKNFWLANLQKTSCQGRNYRWGNRCNAPGPQHEKAPQCYI